MKSLAFLLLVALASMSATPTTTGTAVTNSTFATQLFHTITKEKASDNVILSPASIETCLALTYLGAEGATAKELQSTLQLGSDKQQVAAAYSKIFDKTKADGSAKLSVANRIYVAPQFELAGKYNELAEKYFHAKAENVKFAESSAAADKINAWIEAQTANRIQKLLSADSLDDKTAAVLVNAVYFKADWRNIFDGYATQKKDFKVSQTRQVPVDMMSQEDTFLYGELPDLDATAVEMEYLETDITMLVILPKRVDGLAALEQKLQHVDLTKVASQLRSEKVKIELPKFKIEFEVSLQPVLEELGIKTMFTPAADFSSLLAQPQQLSISEVKHKAFIEVNEEGTEASAATYAKAVLESFVLNEVIHDFIVDHPFFFALKDKEMVYFVGHVVNFS